MTEQVSMFGKSNKEILIERQLKGGSGFKGGKQRIYNFYKTKPLMSDFAKFLQKEYGEGGYCAFNDYQNHDAKGIYMSHGNDVFNPQISLFLTWTEVAEEIAKLIDGDNYL